MNAMGYTPMTTKITAAERDTRGPPKERFSVDAEDGEYEVLRGPEGEITIRRLADGKTGDPTGNVYILANSIPLLENMDAVATVKGDEIPTTEKSGSNNILKYFDSIGNKVFRAGLGEVLLDKYGAKATAVKEHHPSRVKYMAIAAVPAVIQNGRLIHSEIRNGKQSYTLAAPADFLGKPVYVAAVVHEVVQDGKPTNKFYLDEIVDLNGYRFNIENKKAPMDPKYGATKGNGATETSTALSDNSIRSSSENSNPQNGGRASVEVPGEAFSGYSDNQLFEHIMELEVEIENTEQLIRQAEGRGAGQQYLNMLNRDLRDLNEQVSAAREAFGNREIGTAEDSSENARGNETSLDELRREYRERTEAYTRANEANDQDYDYEGEGRRIGEIERLMQAAEKKDSSAAAQNDRTGAEKKDSSPAAQNDSRNMYDEHPERGPIGKDGLRTCRDADAFRDELNEIGGARLKNDTGKKRALFSMQHPDAFVLLAFTSRPGIRVRRQAAQRRRPKVSAGFLFGVLLIIPRRSAQCPQRAQSRHGR